MITGIVIFLCGDNSIPARLPWPDKEHRRLLSANARRYRRVQETRRCRWRESTAPSNCPPYCTFSCLMSSRKNSARFWAAFKGRTGENKSKLLSAVSANDILPASTLSQELSQSAQQCVPRLMAKRVIEALEVIDISISSATCCLGSHGSPQLASKDSP